MCRHLPETLRSRVASLVSATVALGAECRANTGYHSEAGLHVGI